MKPKRTKIPNKQDPALSKIFEKLKSAEVPLRLKNEITKHYPDKFQKGKIKNNTGAFLYGPAGTGKTLKAIALVLDNFNTPRDLHKSFMFGNVNEILFQIKQTFSKFYKPKVKKEENELYPEFYEEDDCIYQIEDNGKTPEEQILDKYTKPDFLVLDDLGVEKTTEFTNQTLYLIINRRYENEKVTFVTSNFSPEELEEKMDDNRIISRLMADCVPIKMTKSHRNK